MLPALTALLALQSVETRAEDARRRVADAPARIGTLDAQLADATAALETGEGGADRESRPRGGTREGGRRRSTEGLQYKDQLMQAKDNRQFHALQHEIATFSTEVQRIEEQVLVRMLEGDELGAR